MKEEFVKSKFCPRCKSTNHNGRQRNENMIEIWCLDCKMVWWEIKKDGYR